MPGSQQPSTPQTISANGTYLYYEKSGKGEPLLLLHGWTQTSAFWKPYVAQFETDYEVYAIDLRGHGKSPALTRDFTIQLAARDIADLLATLQLKSVRAVGLSYGGLVLLELNKLNKEVIKSMVVIGTSYRYDGRIVQKDKPAFKYDSLDPAFKKLLLQHHIHGEGQVKALFDPEVNYSINLSVEDLENFQSRVLIINGDSDDIADIRQAVEMRQVIPGAALWIIPQTGHLALTDANRQEFIDVAKSFFARPDK